MYSNTAPSSADAPAGHRRGPGPDIYVAFVPWVLFSLIAQQSALTWAAICALAASAMIALPSLLKGHPKLLEIGAVLTFAGFTVVALTDPGASQWVTHYARAIAAAVLAVIAFGSLLVVPFTEQYARESVPRRLWSSPQFHEINQRLTTTWALAFTAMVPAHLIAGAIGTHRANLFFNWAIPIALIIWAAKRSARVSDAAGQQA
jgi:hypothetical protein